MEKMVFQQRQSLTLHYHYNESIQLHNFIIFLYGDCDVKSEGHHQKEERKGRCVLFLGSAPIFVDDTVRGGCSTQ